MIFRFEVQNWPKTAKFDALKLMFDFDWLLYGFSLLQPYQNCSIILRRTLEWQFSHLALV